MYNVKHGCGMNQCLLFIILIATAKDLTILPV